MVVENVFKLNGRETVAVGTVTFGSVMVQDEIIIVNPDTGNSQKTLVTELDPFGEMPIMPKKVNISVLL